MMVDALGGGGPGFIGLRKQREPLDQTDLRNSVDATLGIGGGTFWKLTPRAHCHGLANMVVGSAGPTW